jgi:hypothetical protein
VRVELIWINRGPFPERAAAGSVTEAAFLREQAARCRRLAGTVTTPDVVETLLQMAKDYEARAAEFERQEEGKGP